MGTIAATRNSSHGITVTPRARRAGSIAIWKRLSTIASVMSSRRKLPLPGLDVAEPEQRRLTAKSALASPLQEMSGTGKEPTEEVQPRNTAAERKSQLCKKSSSIVTEVRDPTCEAEIITKRDPNCESKKELVRDPTCEAKIVEVIDPTCKGEKITVIDPDCPARITEEIDPNCEPETETTVTDQMPVWVIQNSWNTWWGDNGFVRIEATDGAGVCTMNYWTQLVTVQ